MTAAELEYLSEQFAQHDGRDRKARPREFFRAIRPAQFKKRPAGRRGMAFRGNFRRVR